MVLPGAREAALRGPLSRATARQGRSTLKSATCRCPAALFNDKASAVLRPSAKAEPRVVARRPRSSASPRATRPATWRGGGGTLCQITLQDITYSTLHQQAEQTAAGDQQ